MDIDNLTIKEAREIAAIFAGTDLKASASPNQYPIGKYVIIRSRNEGLNAGYLVSADANGCVISDARRLWYSKPFDSSLSWYEGVAVSGVHPESKLSGEVSQKVIVEDYSITVCSNKAAESIQEAPAHGS
ncbi:MAG: hypothetical protein OEQ39_05640 [Gammaproteobacteria bacterium]|nr:hypothetical protein [Gammaproteobacteria bacterium]